MNVCVRIFLLFSDRGLCGGIHSFVTKAIKPIVAADHEAKVIIYGDKVRTQLQRVCPKQIQLVFAEVGKKVWARFCSPLPAVCVIGLRLVLLCVFYLGSFTLGASDRVVDECSARPHGFFTSAWSGTGAKVPLGCPDKAVPSLHGVAWAGGGREA